MRRIIAVALALTIPSALNAQIIEACYVKNTGTMYRVEAPNSPAKCANNHISFSWNQAGQAGPQGIQGPVGPQGPAGASGVMGYAYRPNENAPAPIPAGAVQTRTRFCWGGEVVTGGGFHTAVQHDDLQVVYSGPAYKPEFNLYGWEVRVRNTSSTTAVTVEVVALCAQPGT